MKKIERKLMAQIAVLVFALSLVGNVASLHAARASGSPAVAADTQRTSSTSTRLQKIN